MDKSPDAFRTISEVAEDLDLPQHVLRFWETRFSQIRPLKRGGGRRYYRPDDVDLLKGIRHLLYGEGYTIKGVQRILKSEGIRFVQGVGRGEETVSAASPEMQAEAVEDTAALGAPAEQVLPAAALQRLRGALDELREADRVLSTLDANEPLRD
jgi:DNA-binding transcriptional MerR regulator